MRKGQVTEIAVPTFSMLPESSQREYMETGYVSYDAEQYGPTRCGHGKVAQHEDMSFFERLFNADYCRNQESLSPVLLIISMDYGVIKVEVFDENYLLSCQNEYEENIILRLVYEGLQVQIVGEGRFISVTRNKKK